MRYKVKFLLVILISPFYLTSCAGTQDLAPDGSKIPFEVNTIIIKTDKTVDEAFKSIGRHFIKEGYAIKNSSPEFNNVTTEFKNAPSGFLVSVDISISASVLENSENAKILLTGTLKQNSLGGVATTTIKQKGQSGSPMRVAWDEFYSFAKSYSDKLSFEKR
jgi:hypothetical protein